MKSFAVVLVIVFAGSTAYAQCCKKGGSCAAKPASAAPQASMRPAVPDNFGTRVYQYNFAQAQQVAAQQAFTARQKMIREQKKQKGAAIAAAREAAKQEEPELKPRKPQPKTGVSGLLARAAELAEQR